MTGLDERINRRSDQGQVMRPVQIPPVDLGRSEREPASDQIPDLDGHAMARLLGIPAEARRQRDGHLGQANPGDLVAVFVNCRN
jgi:hypothetical protein